MTERAKVLYCRENRATVVCDEAEGCKSCSGSAFCSVKDRRFEAVFSKKLDRTPKPGERVEVFIPPGKTIFAGFMVLMFPLILFFGAFLLGRQLEPESGEGIHALFGLLGLGLGFVIAFFYNKVQGKHQYPIITAILSDKEEESQL